MKSATSLSPPPPAGAVEAYYRRHAQIYDATRWSFLFGRTAILRDISAAGTPSRILEVGCGTGRNLAALCRHFPRAMVTGVDLSEAMLERARQKTAPFGRRVSLVGRAYAAPLRAGGFDLVLFSYALSMFNPGYEAALAAAQRDLAPGGHVAVVDFHDTRLPVFAQWMGLNHVRMDGQLQGPLRARFERVSERVHSAYGGVWRYLMFVGRKPARGIPL